MSFLTDIAAWMEAQPNPATDVAARVARLVALMVSADFGCRQRAEVLVRRMVYECTDGGLGSGDSDPEYLLAVAQAMGAHGDELMLPHLQRLADAKPRSADWEKVRTAAQNALPVLRGRVVLLRRREDEAQLLRPVDAPAGEGLLRPVEHAAEDTLLRPDAQPPAPNPRKDSP